MNKHDYQDNSSSCRTCGEALAEPGFVSPESDITGSFEDGRAVVVAQQITLCRTCYRQAFARVYPGQECPV